MVEIIDQTRLPQEFAIARLTDLEEAAHAIRAMLVRGPALIRAAAATKAPGKPLHVLIHCNAGQLATVDWGTALASIYVAFEEGIDLHA